MGLSELKFLIDAGVGKRVENYLHERGYDTKAVRAVDTSMSDEDIVRLAASENRIIITMDKDFGELTYHSEMKHSGVLLLRLENATGVEKREVVDNLLSNYPGQIKDNFCVFQNNRFRIRKIKRSS